jgi:hypothetical protein
MESLCLNPRLWHGRPGRAGNSGVTDIRELWRVFRSTVLRTGETPVPRESVSDQWSLFIRISSSLRAFVVIKYLDVQIN